MANGNGMTSPTQSKLNADSLGVIQQRVTGLEGGFRDLESEMGRRFNEVSTDIKGLGTKFDDRQKIQWPALSLIMAAGLAIGGLAYYPIQQSVSRDDAAVAKIVETFVSEKDFDRAQASTSALVTSSFTTITDRVRRAENELDERSKLLSSILPGLVSRNDLDKALSVQNEVRTAERNTTLSRVTALELDLKSYMPRTEMEEFRRTEERIATDQQRQLDDLRRFQNDLVSAKDTIKHLEDRVWALDRGGRGRDLTP